MIAHVLACTAIGYEGRIIDVECDASNGLPSLTIVGLGNKAIDEAKDRVRSAIKNSGLEFSRKRITINLAPASLPKDGTHFDLPIAVALLVISGQLQAHQVRDCMFIGELALDGTLRAVKGIINFAEAARHAGIRTIIMPAANCAQASLIEGVTILGATSLRDVYLHTTGQLSLQPHGLAPSPVRREMTLPKLADISGQEHAKRALMIAAAGHHNILFDGPPGAGKTMLAKSLLSLLPPLSAPEVIEVTKLHSIAGETTEDVLCTRPFRSPHHGASPTSLIGGGNTPRPGEISLAHRGVLFLDELPEYPRSVLEALRQPLEDKQVHIARTQQRVTYPADFMLVATKNPCPCGYLHDDARECTCSLNQVSAYEKRLSGPLLDRIDIIVTVGRVDHTNLLTQRPATYSRAASQVIEARKLQAKRFQSPSKVNAHLTNNDIKRLHITTQAKKLLDQAAERLNLSVRVYFKTIRVAQTIADLESSPTINVSHMSEALQYRPR